MEQVVQILHSLTATQDTFQMEILSTIQTQAFKKMH